MYGIISTDIIPARNEVKWPSLRSNTISEGYGIISTDIIPARNEVKWPSLRSNTISEGYGIMYSIRKYETKSDKVFF